MTTWSPLRFVPRQERVEGLAGELVRIGVGLGEDFRVLDVVECRCRQDAVNKFEPQGFEGTLTDVDTPNPMMHRHVSVSPREPVESG